MGSCFCVLCSTSPSVVPLLTSNIIYRYAMTYPHGVSSDPSDPGHELYADLLSIFQHLAAVTNNGPSAVGGGGTPRIPTKPDICR